jgi:phosphoserine phosphatase RsbU/P
MDTSAPRRPANARLWETLKQDWRYVREEGHPGWRATLRKTVAEVQEFYLAPEYRQRLARTGRPGRWFLAAGWLLKALILKMTPARRVVFLAALVCLWVSDYQIRVAPDVRVDVDFGTFGIVLLIVLLLLELKDKLLARHELEAGRAVQMALMPDRCPELTGWDVWMYTRPANDVGGDLVDCLELGPGRVGFALADVAGKALPAALLMAKVQATLRALATTASSLAELATRTNDILVRDGLPNRFATLVYLDVRDASGTVRLVNAGHLPPVHVTGASFHELPRGDMALGLIAGAGYSVQDVDLQPGDMLVVYSDGLTEALNERGEFYGDDRLRAVFPRLSPCSAREAGERLLASVDAFIGESRPYDDLSLVVLKRT